MLELCHFYHLLNLKIGLIPENATGQEHIYAPCYPQPCNQDTQHLFKTVTKTVSLNK